MLSWIVAAIGLYLMVRAPKPVAVGVFVLPLVVALVVLAGRSRRLRTGETGGSWGGVTAFWGTVHGVFLLAGAVCTCVAFAAGLMYLVAGEPAQAQAPAAVRVRAAEPGAVGAAQPGGDHAGLPAADVRPADRPGAEPRAGRRRRRVPGWTDPKVVSALAMWLVFAVLLHARYRPAMRGRSVMCADDRGVRVPGLHLGGGRGAPPAHGTTARACPGRPGPGGRREAPGPGGRSPLGAGRDPRGAGLRRREDAPRGSKPWCAPFPATSSSVLSTCNRVEVYAAGERRGRPRRPTR